jgi:transcriptional regulator with XRE-family HTH domain
MSNTLEYQQSFWRSNLYEFCEEVLVANRKKYKLSQKTIANNLGINQSEVSRIERGIVKPKNIVITKSICDIYRLNLHEKQKYLELTSGISNYTDTSLVASLLDSQIDSIAILNRSGSPMPAITQSKLLREWITSNINLNDKSNFYINEKISHLLLEESAAWWDVVALEETHDYTNELINNMTAIVSLDTSSNNLSATYLSINKGFHAYISGDYINAKTHFESVIAYNLLGDTLWHYEVIRAYTVTLGKLNAFVELSKIDDIIYKIVSNRSIGDSSKGYLLEGLGRAYTDLNTQKALQYFEHARNHIKLAQKNSCFLKIRQIQLTRSYLDLLKKLHTSKDKLIEIASPSISEAERSGFVRHKLQITNLLNSC